VIFITRLRKLSLFVGRGDKGGKDVELFGMLGVFFIPGNLCIWMNPMTMDGVIKD
jgi:hypothetical protein